MKEQSPLNDLTKSQAYVVASGVLLMALLIITITGGVIGLVWWAVATHTHHLWIFLLAGVGFQVTRTIKNMVLQNIKKGKS
jgi:hypothetical protein